MLYECDVQIRFRYAQEVEVVEFQSEGLQATKASLKCAYWAYTDVGCMSFHWKVQASKRRCRGCRGFRKILVVATPPITKGLVFPIINILK